MFAQKQATGCSLGTQQWLACLVLLTALAPLVERELRIKTTFGSTLDKEKFIRILLLDIEISPTLATVWGLFNQNLSPDHIIGNSEVLCWSAKWLGEDDVMFSSKHRAKKRAMLGSMHSLLEQADVVVTYNGNSFDLKILNKEFLLLGMSPPAPYKSVDLLSVVRKRFRFTSNKLGYVAEQLKLGSKVKHAGLQLWIDCMNPRSADYEKSWAMMEQYNIQDVRLLESLYTRVMGWIGNHPNRSVETGECVCPNCGSHKVQRRGYMTSAAMLYARFRCSKCGKWSRSRTAERRPAKDQLVGVS